MKGLAGDPLAWSLLTGAFGFLLWAYEHHFQRFTLWLFAASAAFAVAGIPSWRDALAGLTITGGGLTVLGVLVMVFGPAFHFSAVRSAKGTRLSRILKGKGKGKDKGQPGTALALMGSSAPKRNRYHRTFSPAVALVAGTLFAVVLGGWRLMAAAAGKSLAGAGADMLQSSAKISNGTAAKGVPASHRPELLLIGVVVLIVFFFILRAIEKAKRGAQNKNQRGGGAPRGAIRAQIAGRNG
jgi:hypothetical protein